MQKIILYAAVVLCTLVTQMYGQETFDDRAKTISENIKKITSEEKEGLASVSAARPQVEGIIRDKKKAEKIKATIKGKTLEAIATDANAAVQRADSIGFSFSMITGLGNEPKLVGAAFNKALINKVSEPIAANTGVYAVSVNAIAAKQADQDPNFFKDELLERTRGMMFRSASSFKKIAKIEDNRSKIY